jgi:hypothetical protein
MRTKAILSIAGGVALALGVAQTASAANGLGTLHGTAGLQAGVVDGDTTPEGGVFFFTGTLSNGSTAKVCSVGVLSNATCSDNQHAGSYQICSTGCSVTCTVGGVPGQPCPLNGAFTAAAISSCTGPLQSGTFSGVCAGSNCSGGSASSPGLLYSLFFDLATIQNAVTQCSGTGSITSATFDGILGFGP